MEIINPNDGWKTLMVSTLTEPRMGELRSRVILSQVYEDDPQKFVTHIECFNSDGSSYLIWGHYFDIWGTVTGEAEFWKNPFDDALDSARMDFFVRCHREHLTTDIDLAIKMLPHS